MCSRCFRQCQEPERSKLLEALLKLHEHVDEAHPSPPFLKFIVTIRPYPSIESKFNFQPAFRLNMEECWERIDLDIELFIKARVKTIASMRMLPTATQEKLQNDLVGCADRTFLWVSLILDLI